MFGGELTYRRPLAQYETWHYETEWVDLVIEVGLSAHLLNNSHAETGKLVRLYLRHTHCIPMISETVS